MKHEHETTKNKKKIISYQIIIIMFTFIMCSLIQPMTLLVLRVGIIIFSLGIFKNNFFL